MISYEKEYSMTWKEFINKFEKGELDDDRVWFRWYGLYRRGRAIDICQNLPKRKALREMQEILQRN
jgi:hypothetical protein